MCLRNALVVDIVMSFCKNRSVLYLLLAMKTAKAIRGHCFFLNIDALRS